MTPSHFNPPIGRARNYRHGHKLSGKTSPEYGARCAMRARCNNPKTPNYFRYGGRGIRVCPRWEKSFIAFLTDMGRRPVWATSIERKRNDGNYTKGNCRWANDIDQANNRRTSRRIEFRGETLTLAQWAKRLNISMGTLHARLKSGWSVKRAIETPLRWKC